MDKRKEEEVKKDYSFITNELNTYNNSLNLIKNKKDELTLGKRKTKKQIESLIKEEKDIKKTLEIEIDTYITKKEINLFNLIILLSFIPAITSGSIIALTGNLHLISNMGLNAIIFTGFPQFFIGTGIYYMLLNTLHKIYTNKYKKTDEFKQKENEINSILKRKKIKERQQDAINNAISKCNNELKKYNDKITYIRSQMRDLENELSQIMYIENQEEINSNIKKYTL